MITYGKGAPGLAELCALTLDWLHGRAKELPDYYAPCDVDEAPLLWEALVALNSAGILTTDSQEGYVGPDDAGRQWVQYAAVDGFADDAGLALLISMVHASAGELGLVAHPCKSWWRRSLPGVMVTYVDGRGVTGFGWQRTARSVAWSFGGCSNEATKAACAAAQFVLYDTEPGRNDLWPEIAALESSRGESNCDPRGDPQ